MARFARQRVGQTLGCTSHILDRRPRNVRRLGSLKRRRPLRTSRCVESLSEEVRYGIYSRLFLQLKECVSAIEFGREWPPIGFEIVKEPELLYCRRVLGLCEQMCMGGQWFPARSVQVQVQVRHIGRVASQA